VFIEKQRLFDDIAQCLEHSSFAARPMNHGKDVQPAQYVAFGNVYFIFASLFRGRRYGSRRAGL
jgi:hypothetical protein